MRPIGVPAIQTKAKRSHEGQEPIAPQGSDLVLFEKARPVGKSTDD
jgi:hypothetical protein